MMNDVKIRPGIGGNGKPKTFAELLDQKLSGSSSRPQAQRVSSPQPSRSEKENITTLQTVKSAADGIIADSEAAEEGREPGDSARVENEEEIDDDDAAELAEFERIEQMVQEDKDNEDTETPQIPVASPQPSEAKNPKPRVHFAPDVFDDTEEWSDDVVLRSDDPIESEDKNAWGTRRDRFTPENTYHTGPNAWGTRTQRFNINVPDQGSPQSYPQPYASQETSPTPQAWPESRSLKPQENPQPHNLPDPDLEFPRDSPGYEYEREGYSLQTEGEEGEEGGYGASSTVSSPPQPRASPVSRVVKKYFSAGRNGSMGRKGRKGGGRGRGEVAEEAEGEGRGREEPRMKDLEKKVKRLEREISRYKAETKRMKRLQVEAKLKAKAGDEKIQKKMESLERERRDFNRERAEEQKRLKKERARMEKRYKELIALPARQEREELAEIKHRLAQAKQDFKRKEDKLKSTISRLRTENSVLSKENKALRKQLEDTESERINIIESYQKLEKSHEKLQKKIINRSKPCIDNTMHVNRQSDGHQYTYSDSIDVTGIQDPCVSIIPSDGGPGMFTDSGALTYDARLYEEPESIDISTVKNGPNSSIIKSEPSYLITRHADYTHHPNSTKLRSDGDDILRGTEGKAKSALDRRINEVLSVRAEKVAELVAHRFTVDTDIDHRHVPVRSLVNHPDGKKERVFKDGSIQLTFTNGTKKLQLPSGYVQIQFPNGDTKEHFPSGRVIYHYEASEITQITEGKTEVFYFANGQMERHFNDGSKEIFFADESAKFISIDGAEFNVLPNGKVYEVTQTGIESFSL